MIKIKVEGVEKLTRQLKAEATKVVAVAKPAVMRKLKSDLKDATPVKTGKARDGWYTTENSIENNVDYIDTLNGGSSKQAPSRFVEETVLDNPLVKANGIIVHDKPK